MTVHSGIVSKLKTHKGFAALFVLILILGLFLRLQDYSEVSYWNDDMTTIPTGLLWFYPHDYYPGLAGQGEPAVGNFFIGLGCLLSGEDFSGVTQIKPMFYPGREIFLGESLTRAEDYCHSSMYAFGILFFLLISLFSLSLLDIRGALYSTAFFAFFPAILKWSRWIHVEIILYTFVIAGLFALWKAYTAPKGRWSELLGFTLAFTLFGFAFGTKLPAALYFFFAGFILLSKYWPEVLALFQPLIAALNLRIARTVSFALNPPLLRIVLFSTAGAFLAVLVSFSFRLSNIFAIIERYQSVNPGLSNFGFNTYLVTTFVQYFYLLNVIDLIFLIFAIPLLVMLFRKKRNQAETFILGLVVLLLLGALFSTPLIYSRVFLAFSFGLTFLVALLFSEHPSPPFSRLRLTNAHFTIFLLVYIAIASTLAYQDSPYFSVTNHALCWLSDAQCRTNYEPHAFMSSKQIAAFLSPLLHEEETFLPTSMVNYYLRREDPFLYYIFTQEFQRQTQRAPILEDFLRYYTPNKRALRYILIDPAGERPFVPEVALLRRDYKPNHTFQRKGEAVLWIYDLRNLEKR